MSAQPQSRTLDRESMMLNLPMSRIIPKMAIPTIIAFLINSIYSLADTYFVSSLGTNATAAVSVNSALDQIIMMGGSLLAVGANSCVARLLGARRKQEADETLSTAFFLAFGFGLVLALFGSVFMRPMVRMLGATPTCEQYSVDYATYVLLAAPFMTSSFVMNQCLRAEGSAMLSMIGMGFGGILNCFLDPVFILNQGDLLFGTIPMPIGFDMGVAGASLATAISKLVSFAILLFPYVFRRSLQRLSIRHFRFSKKILSEVITVGTPSMLRSLLAVVAGILLNNLAGEISDSVLAGIGVTTKIMMFPFSIILGFGTGFQPVAGFNWGAKRYDRVEESFRYASRMAVIGATVMAAALALGANWVITVFGESDPEMQRIGGLCIRLQCLALPIHAWVAVVNMYCNGLGHAKKAFVLATSRQGSCFLPILYPLTWIFAEYGIAAVQAVADVLSIFLAIPILRKVKAEVKAAKETAAASGIEK